MTTRTLIFCMFASVSGLAAAPPAAPNVVFFLVDDMGWQDTSVPFLYDDDGNPVVTPLNRRYRTPAMEEIAAAGMKFTNAYSMPVCTPSRVCWLTGKNSVRHHVTNWTHPQGIETTQNQIASHRSPAEWRRSGLPQDAVVLPRMLQEAGYRTIHAGKAHFGASEYARDPRNIGFDVNIAGSEIGHPGSFSGDFGQSSNRPVSGMEAYHDSGIHLTDATTIETMKAIGHAVRDEMPFFAYVAHYAVHSPFEIDRRFAGNYPDLSGNLLGYATLLEGMDKSLGDLVAHLHALGVAENTLIVFMSDNGGDAPERNVNDSNAPLRHKKGSKYEGGVRVPMLVAWAARNPENPHQQALPVPAGSRVDDIVAIFDLFPTLAAVAGIDVPEGIDGHNLTPYLRGEAGTHRPQELLIHYPHDHRSQYFTILRQDRWKLIHSHAPRGFELFDLGRDLSETENLADAEPERVRAMAARAVELIEEAGGQWPVLADDGSEDRLQVP